MNIQIRRGTAERVLLALANEAHRQSEASVEPFKLRPGETQAWRDYVEFKHAMRMQEKKAEPGKGDGRYSLGRKGPR